MSIHYLNQAFRVKLDPGIKLTLLALADCASDTGKVFPSWARLEEKTSQSRRTIARHLKELRDMGMLVETGDYVGKTKQIRVYLLDIEKGAMVTPFEGERVPLWHGDPCHGDTRINQYNHQIKGKGCHGDTLSPTNGVHRCETQGCDAEARFTNNTKGGGPWYCAEHFQ